MEAFTKSKVLRYYGPELPVVLQVDASQHGLGAALLQQDQPVAWASCVLTKTEQKYAQIEKECLAISFGFSQFHQYLFGKKDITVHSDHKPLETIFKKTQLDSPKRLQKMRLQLQRYSFNIECKPSKSLVVADTLSQAFLPKYMSGRNNNFEVFANGD